MSTWTLPSFSYLCTPAAAIFQNSLVLLVTKASLTSLPGAAAPAPSPAPAPCCAVFLVHPGAAPATSAQASRPIRPGVKAPGIAAAFALLFTWSLLGLG